MHRTQKPRRTKHNKDLAPSAYRPHVRADQRLLAWSTPAALAKRVELASRFGTQDARAMLELRLFALEPKTRSNYAAGLLRFAQYCDSRNIPEADRMPASEDLLSTFATVMAAGKVGKPTLENWLSGLATWHSIHGFPWYGSRGLRLTKTAVAKLTPESSIRAKRPPVTLEHMHALRIGLNLRNSFDCAVWAVATVAFWSCCRLGELTVPSAVLFDPARHVSQAAVVRFKTLPGGQMMAVFHIPWSKTTREQGADIVVTANNDVSSAYSALKHHIAVNIGEDGSATASPLFSYRIGGGKTAPMTRDLFLKRCERVWTDAGFPNLYGHAFRIGGATELLMRGTHPDVVQVQGRWKSQAFLEYWRKIEDILPLFITDSFLSSRAASLTKTMSQLARRRNVASSR